MRYLVDVTHKQVDEINKLINAGKYQTVAQFISAAIENQIFIEKSEINQKGLGNGKEENEYYYFQNNTIKNNNKITLTEIKSQPKIVPMPTFQRLSCSAQKIDEEKCWLWGQTNRILPVKIGLRVLYAVLGSEQWMDLEDYKNKAADTAAEFGSMIRRYEDKSNKTRDERISAGLPEEKEFKSKSRYKGHFLAYMRKDGRLDGAMPFLKFANLTKDKKDKILIGLTDAGLNFARLENPVIDHQNFEKSFTEEEISFYLDHILKNIKGESSAISWLLSKLKSGITNREKINNELKKEFDKSWDASDAVVNTQRAGLIARMFEIGLIDKKKDGITVTYIINDSGSKFLKDFIRS